MDRDALEKAEEAEEQKNGDEQYQQATQAYGEITPEVDDQRKHRQKN